MKTLIIALSKISRGFLKGKKMEHCDVFSPNSSIEGFRCFNNYANIDEKYDVVFLGCKPQHLENVAKNLPRNLYNNKTIFISVLAGKSVKEIQKSFNITKVFRVMPSIAFEFGNSFIASFLVNILQNEKEEILQMFLPNKMIFCQTEQEIDEFTAIYGSGIGFVFQIMEEYLTASKKFLPNISHEDLILNLFENAVQFAKTKQLNFKNSTQAVASKGGTTEAGLKVLLSFNFQELFLKTMQASLNKATELSK